MIHKFKTEETGIGFDFDVEFEPNQKIHCIIGINGIGITFVEYGEEFDRFVIKQLFL